MQPAATLWLWHAVVPTTAKLKFMVHSVGRQVVTYIAKVMVRFIYMYGCVSVCVLHRRSHQQNVYIEHHKAE